MSPYLGYEVLYKAGLDFVFQSYAGSESESESVFVSKGFDFGVNCLYIQQIHM